MNTSLSFIWYHSPHTWQGPIILYGLQCILSAMTSKNKNGGNSWGDLYGRPMECWVFCYDRHKEIKRYFRWEICTYHPMVMCVFCLPLKIFGWFIIPDAIQYTNNLICFTRYINLFLHLDLSELLLFKQFSVQKIPPTKAAIFAFWHHCG